MKKILSLGAAALLVLSACQSQKTEEPVLTKSGLNPADFETVVDGDSVALYTLTNANGMEVCVTNFGGRIVSIMAPAKDGNMYDVVLGHDSIADYLNIDGNFGALIGRYGNRIENGKFSLDGVEYVLPQNNYGHCLHGGTKGFHNAVWKANQTGDNTIELTLSTPDGYAGFPGNVDAKVVYTLDDENALHLDYTATTDKKTVLNLTNHSYSNLNGDCSKTILNHVAWIDADAITPIDSTFMTHGTFMPVEGTPFDFRTPKTIGQDIEADHEQLRNGLGIDHNFVLNTGCDLNKVAARVVCPETGIGLEVYTNEPGIQVYVGNFLDGSVVGKKGVAYPKRGAICLETQHFPNTPNQPEYPSCVVEPGQEYHSTCIYKFIVAE